MSKHILIAEDETVIANMMGQVLRNDNVRVTITRNGQETLEVMKKDVPDLLLLDLLLPKLDGYGVMKAMKEKKLDCPVIVVTNVSDKSTRDACKEFDVKGFFVKSDMDDNALWDMLEKYLR